MMELTCAFILISASLVLATPHGYGGYGVKGGASARAEASATAGAFGGVPVPVPLGTGFSGSFSKSSSSSSASSSASSSSSSSSFSYSGSGAGGFGLEGGVPNHGGSSAGNCHTAGCNGVPTPHGSSAQGYNSANVAASADAGAVSGLGCPGLSCDGNSDKCKSGQCKPNPHAGTTSVNFSPNKCTSGLCGSASENSATPADYDSNDIRAVSYSSDSAHNSNDQLSGTETSSSTYNPAGLDCSQGKCSPSGSSNIKPNDYGHDLGYSYQGSSASNKPQASSADTGITSQYQKPSSHLETPKIGSKCNSGNCYAGSAESGHETSPSSYNVPIHGAYDKDNQKHLCDGVKCENQPKSPYSPTDSTVTKGPSSFDYPSSMNCGGSNCFGIPANQATGQPSHTVSPSNVLFGHSPSSAPTLSVTNCNSPNCSPYPTNPAGLNVAPGHIGHVKPSDGNKLSNDKLPAYTGGFGGPAGVLNPNEYSFSAPTGNPSHGPAITHSGKPLEGAPTGCNTPSCSGYTSTSRPIGNSVPEGAYNLRPGGDIPSEKLPTYTGGFGGPTGMLNPNEFDVHGTITNKPNIAHSVSPSYNTKLPAGNIGTLGCKVGENCGGHAPTAGATSGATVPSGYYGTKPQTGINSNDGLGGPGVIFNPDKYYTHATGPSNSGYTPSQTFNSPTSSSHPGGCKTPNCLSTFGSTTASYAPAESVGVTKASSGTHLSSVTLPSYTSNYDRPTGVHRPSDISGPASTSSFTNTQSISSTGSYSNGCTTGNCANYPTGGLSADANAQSGSFGVTKPNVNINTASTHPQYTGGFGGLSGTFKPNEHTYVTPTGSAPTNCRTPNCVGSPSASADATSGANAQPGTYGITKPSGGNHPSNEKPIYTGGFGGATDLLKPHHPQYTGGFGGLPGTFKPSEHTYVTPSTGSAPTTCRTPNCVGAPSASADATSGANAQPGTYGITKPSGGNNPSNEKPIYTGGFGGNGDLLKPPHSQHTGGFGGISGTFKPNEHTYVTPSTGSAPTNCRTPNCIGSPSASADATSGANAQPGTYGITKPSGGNHPSNEKPIYTGGFGGAADLLKPPHPQYTGGFGGLSGTFKPNEHTYVTPSTGSAPTNCRTPNCVGAPSASADATSGANAQTGTYSITKPSGGNHPSNEKPIYTGGFGGAADLLKPPHPQYTGGFGGSAPTNCRTPNCVGAASANADATSGANAQPGPYGITKPSGGNNLSNEKPIYTGGFGGAAGLLKPNEYTVPAVNSKPNNKPTVPTTAICTSGHCDTQPLQSSAQHLDNVSTGAHVTAAAAAEANAVAYSGGFGGPPGILAPYDDGKIGVLPTIGGQAHVPQIGGAHGSHNANIHSQHGKITVANGGLTGPSEVNENTGTQAGSVTGSTAYAGAVAGAAAGTAAGASAGAVHGYNTHGSHYNHDGNFKGGSPCSAGCGGSPSVAAAKSLSGSNAFGVGGIHASSSASAHASAGAYTKGGYGKR